MGKTTLGPLPGGLVICHNGFIKDKIKFSRKFKPFGKTDSEQLFYSILSRIKEEGFPKMVSAIHASLDQCCNREGTNLILSSRHFSCVAV